jgi:hypothetical protein
MHQGSPIEYEFSSADAQTADAIVLREAGSRTERVLAANERVIIHSVNAVVGAAITVTLAANPAGDGGIDTGDRMAVFGQGSHTFWFGGIGMAGAPGITPIVKASGAGQIDMTGTGVIVKG